MSSARSAWLRGRSAGSAAAAHSRRCPKSVTSSQGPSGRTWGRLQTPCQWIGPFRDKTHGGHLHLGIETVAAELHHLRHYLPPSSRDIRPTEARTPSSELPSGPPNGLYMNKLDVEYRAPNWLVGPVYRTALQSRNPFIPANDDSESIFIHVPKTAGRSVGRALFDRPGHHVSIKRYYLFEPQKTDRFFKFTIVRNPWDRLLSAFNAIHRRPTSVVAQSRAGLRVHAAVNAHSDFQSFVHSLSNPQHRTRLTSWTLFRPQYKWISIHTKQGPRIAVDHIGRYESLNEEYEFLAKRLGRSAELPSIGRRKAAISNRHEAYDLRAAEIVAAIYAEDIRLFGYSFEES